MKRYRCIVCGYVYDPVEGDPTAGIEPGTTTFEDLSMIGYVLYVAWGKISLNH